MAAAPGRGVTWCGCVRDEAPCNGGRAALFPPPPLSCAPPSVVAGSLPPSLRIPLMVVGSQAEVRPCSFL